MLHIDRVHTQMDVLPGDGDATAPAGVGASAPVTAIIAALTHDRVARQQFSALVLDVMREHLRALERQGTL